MIFDELAELFEQQEEPAHSLARKFGRKRKFVYAVEAGCGFRLDLDFVCGLNKLGYDLKLVKRERPHSLGVFQ